MRLSEFFKGSSAEDPHDKMAQNLLSSIKQNHEDEFSRDDALEVYAKTLGMQDRHQLQESQKLHVGRLLAKLSKQHDVFEIDSRYVFPAKKETLH